MKTQYDGSMRVVTLANLLAMADNASGVCHNYKVVKRTPNRVWLQYSNPDEYGTPHPMNAVFPVFPNEFEKQNPFIVLHFIRVEHDNCNGEGWQSFDPVTCCPPMTRQTSDAPWTRQGPEKEMSGRLS